MVKWAPALISVRGDWSSGTMLGMTKLELGCKFFPWHPALLPSRQQIRSTSMVLDVVVFVRLLVYQHVLVEQSVIDLVQCLCYVAGVSRCGWWLILHVS